MAEQDPMERPEQGPEGTPEQGGPEPADASSQPTEPAGEPAQGAEASESFEDAGAAASEALAAAEQAAASLSDEEGAEVAQDAGDAAPFKLQTFDDGVAGDDASGIDLLSDVNLNVKIELGRTAMLVEDVLRLAEGSVVELDKLAGDPVDIFVNDRPVARGEVLVLNDNFCVRINEILASPGAGGGDGEAAA